MAHYYKCCIILSIDNVLRCCRSHRAQLLAVQIAVYLRWNRFDLGAQLLLYLKQTKAVFEGDQVDCEAEMAEPP